ncbi:hypothetical protein P5V15_014084 [Pogonomyrmex californicus]
MPIAQFSIFSWIILKPINTSHPHIRFAHQGFTQQEDDIKELLTKFWVQEELPIDNHSQLSPEEEKCETHFRTTYSRDSFSYYSFKRLIWTIQSANSTQNICNNVRIFLLNCLEMSTKDFTSTQQK